MLAGAGRWSPDRQGHSPFLASFLHAALRSERKSCVYRQHSDWQYTREPADGTSCSPERRPLVAKPSTFLGTLLGAWHKENYLAAVIDDLRQAEQAVEALRQAGWSAEEIRLFHGQDVAQHIATIEQRRSLPTKIAAAVRGATSEEGSVSEHYEAEAAQGHQLLAVYAESPEQVEQARRILAVHQAHAIEYFGSWAITDLPQHNTPQHDAPS